MYQLSTKFPFVIGRSTNGGLPVYTRYAKKGIEVTTWLRHFWGDAHALKKELMIVCEAPVRQRAGKIEVRGLQKRRICGWIRHQNLAVPKDNYYGDK